MSLQWTLWLAGSHFIKTPGRYSKKFQAGGLHSDVQSPTPSYQPFIYFISYHHIFIYFVIYNRKGNPFVHIVLKIGTPFTYMYLVNNFSFLITRSSSVNGLIIWQSVARLPSFFTLSQNSSKFKQQ